MHQRSKGFVWFTHKAIEAYTKETRKPLYMYVPIKSYPDPMSKRKNDYRAELYDESNPLYEKLRKTDINAYCVYLTKKLPDPPEGGHISFYDIGGIHVFNRMDSRYGCDVFEPVLREETIERDVRCVERDDQAMAKVLMKMKKRQAILNGSVRIEKVRKGSKYVILQSVSNYGRLTDELYYLF